MQPWTSRCGYYQEHGPFLLDTSGAPPAAALRPYPDTNLQGSLKSKYYVPFDKRALKAVEKEANMASAQTIQSMRVSGKTAVSPRLAGMFPLILIAGIIVLVVLKK